MATEASKNSSIKDNEKNRAKAVEGSEEAFKNKPSGTREEDVVEHDSPSEERRIAQEEGGGRVEVKQ